MTAIAIVVAIIVIALLIYWLVRPRRSPVSVPSSLDEFAGLSEAERCDYVFAVSALGNPAQVDLLRRALNDPSEVVAIAAARSLVLAGRRDELEALFADRRDDRSARIASALELLA